MAGIDINVNKELLPGLLGSPDGLAKLVESVLNQVLEAQVSESLGAQRHERSEERLGYRNGYRVRQLYTRVGPIALQVPQTRDGSFSTDIFKRYQRSEQAFVLALMEMVVQGVSTRKVAAITEELCGVSFSKSTVSTLCLGLDARVKAFNERRLDARYPFLVVDAMFIQAREDERVKMRTVLTVSGVRSDGMREILGLRLGNSESFTTWDEMFGWLKQRGLSGVAFVVSDGHSGLQEAIAKHFHDCTWQRCQVHLMRNIVGYCGSKIKAQVAAMVKRVFGADDLVEARKRLAEFSTQFAKSAPKAVACLEAGFEDAMAVMALPEKYRKRLRTTNMQERLNEEIRRRERVIRIFPNDASALRLIGALLAEQNEHWQEQRYFNMEEYLEWAQEQAEIKEKNNVVVMTG
jgi:transposase-like protein